MLQEVVNLTLLYCNLESYPKKLMEPYSEAPFFFKNNCLNIFLIRRDWLYLPITITKIDYEVLTPSY